MEAIVLPRVTLGPNPAANPVDGARVGITFLVEVKTESRHGLKNVQERYATSHLWPGSIGTVLGAVTATALQKPFRNDFGATS